MRSAFVIFSACVCVSLAASATDDLPLDLPLPPPEPTTAPTPSTPTAAPPSLLLGVQVGPTFPGVFNKLNVSGLASIMGAYQLPIMQRELGLFLQLSYTQPTANGARTDTRIASNGGSETYKLTVMDLGLAVGLDYVLQLPAKFIGFAALGLNVHFSRSVMEQQAGGADLGTTREDSTRVGSLLRLGCGYQLGPGHLTLEVENEFTGIDHLLTGDANTAHLSTALGYLLRL